MKNLYPIILAIDTSTEICSVAIQNIEGNIFKGVHKQSTHHSQAILPLIEKIRVQAKLELAEINYITLSIGPGSFTGVRAGIATAQGLGYGLGIPIIPFGTLDLIALGLKRETGAISVIMDARMQQYYVATFNWVEDKLVLLQGPHLWFENELLDYLRNTPLASSASSHNSHFLVGTGLKLIQDEFLINYHINQHQDLNNPDAENLISYLNKQSRRSPLLNMEISAIELAPLYIRDQVAVCKA